MKMHIDQVVFDNIYLVRKNAHDITKGRLTLNALENVNEQLDYLKVNQPKMYTLCLDYISNNLCEDFHDFIEHF